MRKGLHGTPPVTLHLPDCTYTEHLDFKEGLSGYNMLAEIHIENHLETAMEAGLMKGLCRLWFLLPLEGQKDLE